ncbi:MAG: DUF5658 family protein [Candidatus Solibacter sp.]
MSAFLIFLVLQAGDLATTLLFLERGVGEANPLVTALMQALGRPLAAVLLFKLAGCLMAGYAWHTGRGRLLRWANAFYALCVGWNLVAIAVAANG